MILVALILLAGALLAPAASGAAAPNQDAAPVPDHAEAPFAQATPDPTGDRSRYTRGESNVIFKWDMLIDALALVVARAWLCCGVIVILAIPILFIVLWNKSQSQPQP